MKSKVWYAIAESYKVSIKLNQQDVFVPEWYEKRIEKVAYLYSKPSDCYSLLFVPLNDVAAVEGLRSTLTWELSDTFEHNGYYVFFSIPHEIDKVTRNVEKLLTVIPFLPAYTEPKDEEPSAYCVEMPDHKRFEETFVHEITRRLCPW